MDDQTLMSHVDLTILEADATTEDVLRRCDEALELGCASLCTHSVHLPAVTEYLEAQAQTLTLCSVIGFPLGAETLQMKWRAAREALHLGAREIDAVIQLAPVKEGNWDAVELEIRGLREATEGYVLKIIVEACYLTEEEKIKLCEIITETGCDYIKTSTGFGPGGATLEDVKLFKQHIGEDVKIKAAGGIRTREAMEAFLEAGADRLGSSRAAAIIRPGDSA